jgi:hypothetical protein
MNHSSRRRSPFVGPSSLILLVGTIASSVFRHLERDVEMPLAQGDEIQIGGEGGYDDSQHLDGSGGHDDSYSRGGPSCGHCWWLG